jgi:alcohol dehydrogenase class IV
MQPFEYVANPSRVIFGSGSVEKVSEQVKRLELKSPLILSTPQQLSQAEAVHKIVSRASIIPAGIYTMATMHTPSHVTNDAVSFAKTVHADCVISIGGGSTIGLGKAISINTGLPHICIPTTYAGSEMTPILGETRNGKKTTRSDLNILPGTVIYDVDLTMTLPSDFSATSGVNAIAHAVESLYARTRILSSHFSLSMGLMP